MVQNISPKFDIRGWNWKKWLKGNKEILKAIVPGVLIYLVTQGIVEAAIGAIIGKAILDIVDFYATEVVLSK